jgi:2-polyprenyl-3-methyl-5-hydroxy-6-metoxy-1,4-benzoquinol methylase
MTAQAGALPQVVDTCPICAGELRPTRVRAFDRLVTGDGPFTVMECAACRYGMTVPQLGDEALAPYYSAQYYEGYYEHSGGEGRGPLNSLRGWFRRWSAARRYRRPPFTSVGAGPGRMLDVGCGAGGLLEHFAQRGWEIHGIEPSSSAAAAAARCGAQVHHGTLRDQPWQHGSFQLVTFEHSLEHIADPIDAIQRARALLAPGGILIAVMPNWSCWQRRLLFRNRWVHLDLPRHQQHFSPRALARLAAALDLQVQAVGTTSTAISVAYSIQYLLFGRWQPGWKLWLSWALGTLVLPFTLLGDRVGEGDCCLVVMEAPRDRAEGG